MKTIVYQDWVTLKGPWATERHETGLFRLDLGIISEGCSVFIQDLDGDEHTGLECAPQLVAVVQGMQLLSFTVPSSFRLFINQRKEGHTAVKVPWVREADEAGWNHDEESFAQIELKPLNAVSAELQAILDAQNENAKRREDALLKEIARLSGKDSD